MDAAHGRQMRAQGTQPVRFVRVIVLFIATLVSLAAATQESIGESAGTAFSIAPELLITNEHVVNGCSSVEVVSLDGRRPATIVAADAGVDLALLRASGLTGTTARLRSAGVRLGEPVMVFGYPLEGLLSSSGNFTSGLISSLRGLRDAANEMQFTAPVQPGNSGGPLLDSSGLVIGVVQSKLSFGAAIAIGDIPQNVNFAISLEALSHFLAKQKVDVRIGSPATALDTAVVAEAAQRFTHRIDCLGRQQQTNTQKLQRAVLYEEIPQDRYGRRSEGTVRWSTAMNSVNPGSQSQLKVRAEIRIPEKKMDVIWTLSRNTDSSLPASHIVEMVFNLPADSRVQNVPGVLMKQAEQLRGVPLAGVVAKVSPGYFVIGLSARENDVQRNIQSLKERAWLDIPFFYNGNRRAILAIEKGPTGEQAFAKAFAVWNQ